LALSLLQQAQPFDFDSPEASGPAALSFIIGQESAFLQQQSGISQQEVFFSPEALSLLFIGQESPLQQQDIAAVVDVLLCV
jgi:hypothetical protein